MIKNNLDKQYLEIAKNILESGSVKETRNSLTTSQFGKVIRHNMFEGFPIYTTKRISIKNVLTELKWFLLGKTDLKWLVDRKCYIWVGDAYKRYKSKMEEIFSWIDTSPTLAENPFIKEEDLKYLGEINCGKIYILSEKEFTEAIQTNKSFSDNWGDLGVIYGSQWREFGDSTGVNNNVDQVKKVINTLKTDPNSRRNILNAWNASELDNMILPPCHMMFQCYTKPLNIVEREYIAKAKGVSIDTIPETGLSLLFYCRSQDYFLGTPYNTVSYGLLLTILAKISGYEPIELIHVMGDTHIYNEHHEAINKQLNNIGHELPKYELKGVFDNVSKYWYDDNFDIDGFVEDMELDDIKLIGYNHDGDIKAPLIN